MGQAILNPRKKFKYRVIIPTEPNLETFGCQEVTLPDNEVESVEHGFGNTVIKTGGLAKVGTLTLNRIMSANYGSVSGTIFREWQKRVQDAQAQIGGDPLVYKGVVIIEELTGDNFVLNTHTFTGCWPTRINGREFSRTDSANTVESVEFAVDYADIV